MSLLKYECKQVTGKLCLFEPALETVVCESSTDKLERMVFR